jgi:RecJ-like exonuclease
MDDDKILERGGTERDIEEYAKQNGADLEKEKEEPCEFCGGSGTITRDYHDPADYYGHGQTEEICICRIGDEDADMDDDS